MSRTVRAKSQRIRFAAKGFFDNDGGELVRVRSLRRQVRRTAILARRHVDHAAPFVAEAVAIRVEATEPYVHCAASVEDLCAVLRALPPGVAGAIRAIDLGAPSTLRDAPSLSNFRDPLTGRPGYARLIGGIYAREPSVVYCARTGTLRVFAQVCERPLHEEPFTALVARLRVLADLMRALASHHHVRPAGRRMLHRTAEPHAKARALADAWIRDVVTPYLVATYPDAAAHFEAWMLRHGGIALRLDALETEGDATAPADHAHMTLFEAFAQVFRKVGEGCDAATTRCTLAFWLHYDYRFDEALTVLDRLLADAPGDADALALRAHIHVHQGRAPDAIDALRVLLASNPDHLQAWHTLAGAYEEVGDVERAREARARADALRPAKRARPVGP